MYNATALEKFIDKVHREASEAAQKVYDQYNQELIQRIQAQMHPDHIVYTGMGSVSVAHKNHIIELPYGYADKYTDVLSCTQYWDKVEAGFNTPYRIMKTRIEKWNKEGVYSNT